MPELHEKGRGRRLTPDGARVTGGEGEALGLRRLAGRWAHFAARAPGAQSHPDRYQRVGDWSCRWLSPRHAEDARSSPRLLGPFNTCTGTSTLELTPFMSEGSSQCPRHCGPVRLEPRKAGAPAVLSGCGPALAQEQTHFGNSRRKGRRFSPSLCLSAL